MAYVVRKLPFTVHVAYSYGRGKGWFRYWHRHTGGVEIARDVSARVRPVGYPTSRRILL
jgi:hypothetical protein